MNEQDKPIAFVEPQKLRELMVADEGVVIFDVRSAEEYASGHVEGAINIPADQLAAQVGELAKDTTIVTVCNFGGSRSCSAAEQLRALGYENAAPLRGGTRGWLKGHAASENAGSPSAVPVNPLMDTDGRAGG